MPIYELTYRTYEGDVRRRFRWAVIVSQELRVQVRSRVLQVLALLPLFHAFLRVLQVVAFDTMAADPHNPIGIAIRQSTVFNVDDRMFYDFLRVQGPFVFLLLLAAGAGMIASDARHNLLEIYFSKPLTWWDYILGKVGTLLVLGYGLTAFPALFLVVLHMLLAPSLDTFQECLAWIPSIVAFSTVIVLPLALGILACSAVFRGERGAGLAATILLVINWLFGVNLAGLLHNRDLLVTSLPTAMGRIGEVIFHQRRPTMDLPWYVAAMVLAVVCAIELAVIVWAARRAERNA